ncbi:MAG: glycosyltransferase family 4 protein [Paracoccaceae bacterium]
MFKVLTKKNKSEKIKLAIYTGQNKGGLKKANELLRDKLRKNAGDKIFIYETQSFFEALNSDVLIVSFRNLTLAIFRALLKKKTIIYFHGFPILRHYNLARYILLSAVYVIFNKIAFAKIYNSKFTKSFAQTHKTSINDFVIYPMFSEVKFSLNLPQPRFVYFGRIDEAKRVDVALQIVRKVHEKNPEIAPLIHTFGKVSPKYKYRFDKLLQTEQVKWHGEYKSYEELKKHTHNSICLFCNELETFGVVFQEAMMLNMVPLVPSSCGFAEVLSNGDLKYDPDNTTQAAEKILDLLNYKSGLNLKLHDNSDTENFISFLINSFEIRRKNPNSKP